jgi:hypothetical protein
VQGIFLHVVSKVDYVVGAEVLASLTVLGNEGQSEVFDYSREELSKIELVAVHTKVPPCAFANWLAMHYGFLVP